LIEIVCIIDKKLSKNRYSEGFSSSFRFKAADFFSLHILLEFVLLGRFSIMFTQSLKRNCRNH